MGNTITAVGIFTSGNPLIVIFGVLLSLGVVLGLLYFILNMTKVQTPQEKLITLVSMGYIILLGIFLVDKVVAFRIALLSEADSATLFSYVKDISTLVFGYYFGTQTKDK